MILNYSVKENKRKCPPSILGGTKKELKMGSQLSYSVKENKRECPPSILGGTKKDLKMGSQLSGDWG